MTVWVRLALVLALTTGAACRHDEPCTGPLPVGTAPSTSAGAIEGRFVRWGELEAMLAATGTPEPGDRIDISSVLVADLDGDGRDDLVYNRRGPSTTFLQVEPGRFEPHALAGAGQCMVAADFDGDGSPDLFCAYGGARVLWNDGAGRFGALTQLDNETRLTMSATAADLDEDGLTDLIVARWGLPQVVLRNTGRRTFEDVIASWGLSYPGLTWGVGLVDFAGDGRPGLYYMFDGHGAPNIALRALGPGKGGEPSFSRVYPMPEGCDDSGLFEIGDATPMGMALADVNADGRFEVFLALTRDSPLLISRPGGWVDGRRSMRFAEPLATGGHALVQWSPYFFDFDRDGLLDLLVPAGDDAGHAAQPGRGLSSNLLYRGLPGGAFEEVHERVGLTDLGDYATVRLADADGDGRPDLFLGGFAQPVRVYRNDIVERGRALEVQLRGTTSNPDGIGARLVARAGGMERAYQVGAHFGPQVSGDRVVDVSLGPAERLDRLEVHWPSGYVQSVRNLQAGRRHVVEEPQLVSIRPESRRVAANGTSEVEIVVRPHSRDSRPVEATVEIRAPFHWVDWTGPVEPGGDGSYRRRLVAPRTPGSAVLEISVDGTPLRVRPRVWFE